METGPRKYAERGMFREVWKAINALIEQQRRIAPMSGENVKVNRTVNGAVISASIPEVEAAVSGTIKQYRVRSVANDHLVCREFDGTSETGGDVLIAKPYNLRRTGWHGISITYTLEPFPGNVGSMVITYSYVSATYRTATVLAGGATGVEHQVILPRYVPNKSVIYAIESSNGTGVAAADFIDINSDGRCFGRAV